MANQRVNPIRNLCSMTCTLDLVREHIAIFGIENPTEG